MSTVYLLYFFFFFSSRRRHTRLVSDWSSDVCSSDLVPLLHSSNLPGLGRVAPVKAPGSYPNNSLSRRSTGKAAQLTLSKGLRERRSEERRVGKECRSRWEA